MSAKTNGERNPFDARFRPPKNKLSHRHPGSIVGENGALKIAPIV